jgi:hypothetical protein
MGDVFILVSNFHVPLALKVGRPCSGVTCVTVLVFIFLCVGLMAVFVVLRFSPVSFLVVCVLPFLSRGVVCLDCWWSFCVFRCHSCRVGMFTSFVMEPFQYGLIIDLKHRGLKLLILYIIYELECKVT